MYIYIKWTVKFYNIFIICLEHGFLRIGSLNVRVKKTTEAFSNFLGVGGDKLHKNWGSADDLPQVVNIFKSDR